MKYLTTILLFLFLVASIASAQNLEPGFDKKEYEELLKISARHADSAYVAQIPKPEYFGLNYRSPVVGLDNRWDLWTGKEDPVAVISIRGTTTNSESWLANFYAAMVPAKGAIQLNGMDHFEYELASNPKAAIHIGWLVSMAFLSEDILPKIDSCYRDGIKSFVIMGHSQGGAIAYLLTSYLYNLQDREKLPADIRWKTYCSAAPKPGNLYYAYEYEAMTSGGWAYNVVNAADWVPETPISIQMLSDFNETNPFKNAKGYIKKQKFPTNMALRHAYNKLNKPTIKAQRNYQKYLGKMASKQVQKFIPGFEQPEYYDSNYYVRTGHTIVLLPDEDYYERFPDSENEIFTHHYFGAYLDLLEDLNASTAYRN